MVCHGPHIHVARSIRAAGIQEEAGEVIGPDVQLVTCSALCDLVLKVLLLTALSVPAQESRVREPGRASIRGNRTLIPFLHPS